LSGKDQDQDLTVKDKDFTWVLKESLRTRTNITATGSSKLIIIGDPISDRIANYCNDLERRFR